MVAEIFFANGDAPKGKKKNGYPPFVWNNR